MTAEREQYTMGYGPAAIALMARRSAADHAAFFLPHVKPGMSVLDCGCGPAVVASVTEDKTRLLDRVPRK